MDVIRTENRKSGERHNRGALLFYDAAFRGRSDIVVIPGWSNRNLEIPGRASRARE
jgi:hypothetical protein